MKQITREWLKEKGASLKIFKFWCENCKGLHTEDQIRKLAEENFTWANWLMTNMMTYKQYVSYSVYSAESVLHIFEEHYPNDRKPREAIKAAKKCIKNPSEENKKVAGDAAMGANYSAYADYSASNAAFSAFYTAFSAEDAPISPFSAACAAHAAAQADSANLQLKSKLIEYGIKLLKGKIL